MKSWVVVALFAMLVLVGVSSAVRLVEVIAAPTAPVAYVRPLPPTRVQLVERVTVPALLSEQEKALLLLRHPLALYADAAGNLPTDMAIARLREDGTWLDTYLGWLSCTEIQDSRVETNRAAWEQFSVEMQEKLSNVCAQAMY